MFSCSELSCSAPGLLWEQGKVKEWCLHTLDFLRKWMVPHFQLDPPEEIFDQKGPLKVNSRPFKVPQSWALSSHPEPSSTLSLHLSIRWNFYFSTIFVHFPMPQRAIWNSSCHFWPLILKTQSLHSLPVTLLISPLSFNPSFTWWKSSKRLQTFQFLAALWWLGEMSLKMTWTKLPLTLRDIFLPWRSSFKGKLNTFFSRSFLKGLSRVLRRLSQSDVWIRGLGSQ